MTSLRERVDAQLPTARADLASLVGFASVHIEAECAAQSAASADWVAAAFAELGLSTEVVVTSDGSPAVIGHRDGPPGSPTVALYAHHDVQPAGDLDLWQSPPFELTERAGRWYGRGAADCKGNLIAHLTALRAVGDDLSCSIRLIIEGSEEAGGEGLDDLVRARPELFDADLILIADAGNVAVGTPTLTTSLRGVANVRVTVRGLDSAVHSGQFGGAAPDALAALVAGLASLRAADGGTVIDDLPTDQHWLGADYPAERFRTDCGAVDGTDLLGDAGPADQVWARPAVTVIGLDAPGVDDAVAAIVPEARALLNLQVPPGMDPRTAFDALSTHLRSHIPWGVRVEIEAEAFGAPFAAATDGPGYALLTSALSEAYDGADVVHAGQGGSIPLCTVLAETVPGAEIALLGVEEPSCRIHAPNESVDPSEIARIAHAEAIVLTTFGSR